MGKESQFEAVVAAYRKMQTSASAGYVDVGRRAHVAVRKRLSGIADPGARRRARGEAMTDMAEAVVKAGFKTAATKLNRMICCHHVGEIYGPTDAKALPWRTLWAFCATIRRVSKDESWILKSKIESKARNLFAQSISGELHPDQVAVEINDLLGRKPRVPKPKASPIRRVLTAIQLLSQKQQVELFHAMQKKFASTPLAASVDRHDASIPMSPPPGKVAEVRRPSLKEKLTRRAG